MSHVWNIEEITSFNRNMSKIRLQPIIQCSMENFDIFSPTLRYNLSISINYFFNRFIIYFLNGEKTIYYFCVIRNIIEIWSTININKKINNKKKNSFGTIADDIIFVSQYVSTKIHT